MCHDMWRRRNHICLIFVFLADLLELFCRTALFFQEKIPVSDIIYCRRIIYLSEVSLVQPEQSLSGTHTTYLAATWQNDSCDTGAYSGYRSFFRFTAFESSELEHFYIFFPTRPGERRRFIVRVVERN